MTERHDFDLKVFWDHVRAPVFKNRLTQGQVIGTESILASWVRWQPNGDLRFIAADFGTTYHETATAMQPVIETKSPNEKTNPSVDEAIRRLENAWAKGRLPWVKKPYWRKDASGLSWLGRGLPQLTFKENYRKATDRLWELGILPRSLDLTKNPDLVLLPDIAAAILIFGSAEGWFTGKKLGDYFTATKSDWVGTRRIINPDDKGPAIAVVSRAFYAALMVSVRTVATPAVVAEMPDPDDYHPEFVLS